MEQLAGLCGRAWELRDTPDFADAIAAIVDWHDRRHVRLLERREQRRADLICLLRETDPARIVGKREVLIGGR